MSDPVFYLRVSPTGVHSIGAPQRSPINEIEKVELLTRLQPAIASFDKAYLANSEQYSVPEGDRQGGRSIDEARS
jgi:hypothetical protein